MVGRDIEIVAVDRGRHRVVILEGERFAAMRQQPLVGGSRFHDAAARRQIAGEHSGRALGIKRFFQRMDDVGQIDLHAGDIFADGAAVDGDGGQIEQVLICPISARRPPA